MQQHKFNVNDHITNFKFKCDENLNREYDMLANFTKETKQLLQDVIKNQETVQKNIDMGFTRLHEQMVNEFYKNIDHQSFINMVDKKFDHLNDVFTKCIDSKPRKVFKDTGENTIEHFIYDSDGFEQHAGNFEHELEYDFNDMSDFNTERLKKEVNNPNIFNQGVGENDIKQDVCLMGGTDQVQ